MDLRLLDRDDLVPKAVARHEDRQDLRDSYANVAGDPVPAGQRPAQEGLDPGAGRGSFFVGKPTERMKKDDVSIQPSAGARRANFTIRCHVAMAFSEQNRSERRRNGGRRRFVADRPLRTDAVRKAFNSPFWPHVLVTTSVGQEGLDFHRWCRTVVHWDLSSNPVDIEQREGRVDRYAGLSVRRVIASKLGDKVLREIQNCRNLGREAPTRKSPWCEIETLAESQLATEDASGMSPWWILDGATIERIIFRTPASEETSRWERLSRDRWLYRIVMGQPNQEVVLDKARKFLRSPDGARALSTQLAPRLSPYFSP